MLGQLETEAKSNEITAIPQLLEMLDLKGATVTIDAMGCQKKIADKIVSGKADYILSLKEDQPSLHREVREFVASAESDGYPTSIERRYYITSLVADTALVGSRIRGHWGIENSLHWVLDIAFDEDRCRVRRGNGPDDFALLRKIAVNLLKAEETCKRGVEGKRKHGSSTTSRRRAAWNNDYLLRVLEAGAKLAVQ